jgi:DNA-binding NarL/FixJ family response regulator
MIKVGIADDHEIFCKSLRDALVYDNDFDVLFTAENGSELLFELDKATIDILILDLRMPVISGTEALPIISEKFPDLKIVILSSFESPYLIIETMQKGAHAFLNKKIGIDTLIEAMHHVLEKGYYFPDTLNEELLKEALKNSKLSVKSIIKSPLTSRELEIIKLICEEKNTKAISEQLNLSERTIENHRYRLSKKIGSSNSINILVYALQNGIAKITAEGKVQFE